MRDPFLRLIADLAPRLKKVSPWMVADPKPNGGSMMRMYRDTRFSKDKTPLKTSIAAHFEHGRSPEGAAPGFYLSLEPGSSGLGSGVWRPEPKALKKIRDAIAKDPKGWTKAVAAKEFKSGCGMMGESLKRPPPGYDADHPCIEDLKRKDFAISAELSDKQVTGAGLLDAVVQGYQDQAKFVRFLCEAIGLEF